MNKRRWRLLAVCGAVVSLTLVLVTSPNENPGPGVFIAQTEGDVVPGRLVVQFRDGVPDEQRDLVLGQYDAMATDRELPPGFVQLEVPDSRRAEIGQLIATSNAVETVSEVAMRFPAFIPDDPAWSSQWNMRMINADVAYDVSDGSGVIVAVVDTGVAYEDRSENGTAYNRSPDLQVDFVDPYDAFGALPDANDSDEHPNDDYGHGTHIANTIAEATNNGAAAAGIAPGVTIMPVKICGPNVGPTKKYACPTDDIAAGITWAVNHGASVLNISIGGGPTDITPEERAAIQFAADAGVVVVAAAGNDTNGGKARLDNPAAMESVVSVGAVGIAEQLAYYSNHGAGEFGQLMDLVAPGGDPNEGPTSTIYQETYAVACNKHDQDYTAFAVVGCRGTSMAAAHVTGVAALIRSAFPSLNATQVREVLHCSAIDLGLPGQDAQYGFGLVQADAALINIDGDNFPDCIDTDVSTPTPTPEPPANDCLPPTPSPSPSPTPTPTPTASPTPSPTPTVPEDEPDDEPTPIPPTASAPVTPTPTPVGQTPAPTDTPPPTPSPTASPSSTPSPSPTPFRIKCGDVDCSGVVTGMDSLGILAWLAQSGPPAECLGKGYVNCDGTLDVVDATTILRFVGGLPLGIPASCPGIW